MLETIHACFISYRHPAAAGGREEKLINQVVKAIADHVQIYTHEHEVFFDQRRLVPGYQYDERLAEAICRSACMVIVYWPSYLESDYCKNEMQAMLDVERRRRQILGQDLHGCRLFIPVILRGRYNDLPDEVTRDCQYLDYKAQATRPDVNLGDDEATSEKLYEIAEYIKLLCDKLKPQAEQLFRECKAFGFQQSRSASAAAAAIQAPPPPPFPGR
ncbi:MAG: toll/interleukin-1 receptor domain-containing protein [Cyanobium sp.]